MTLKHPTHVMLVMKKSLRRILNTVRIQMYLPQLLLLHRRYS